MSIDAIGSKDTPSKTNCNDENDHSASCWNGRVVNIEQHPKPKIVLCSRGTISGAIHDYFDNEKKKQNEYLQKEEKPKIRIFGWSKMITVLLPETGEPAKSIALTSLKEEAYISLYRILKSGRHNRQLYAPKMHRMLGK